MFRTACYWLVGTIVVLVVLLAIAQVWNDGQATSGMAAGIAVSLATVLVGKGATVALRTQRQPLQRLLVATATRFALPLGALLAVAVAKPELLTTEFVLYFLPFQFVTLAADTAGAVRQIEANDPDPSD